jgi:hypothetical protein
MDPKQNRLNRVSTNTFNFSETSFNIILVSTHINLEWRVASTVELFQPLWIHFPKNHSSSKYSVGKRLRLPAQMWSHVKRLICNVTWYNDKSVSWLIDE